MGWDGKKGRSEISLTRFVHRFGLGRVRKVLLERGYRTVTNLRVVEAQSLRPAVEVLAEMGFPNELTKVNLGGLTYLHPDDVVSAGVRHGLTFVPLDEVPGDWREFRKKLDAANKALQSLVEAEAALEGDEYALCPATQVASVRGGIDAIRRRSWSPLNSITSRSATEGEALDSLVRALIEAGKVPLAERRELQAKVDLLTERNRVLARDIDTLREAADGTVRLIQQAKRERKRPKRWRGAAVPALTAADGASVIEGFASVIAPEDLVRSATKIPLNMVSAVYFLLDESDEIVYVGQSTNALGRLGTHLAEGTKEFVAAIAVPVPVEDLLEVEAKYINAYKPKYNKTDSEYIAAQATLRRAKKALQRRSRARWDRSAANAKS
jgi:hypothetical protein